ncbi:SMC-Scp complex subunit ScpB [Kangiella shandongensis]|uniref:SMC-Scp complex subunit ScpB n=1 Tax=Kangiella shandongensis TaxID=2763258 RepID=UPI001CBC0CDA|nr:SMC-Scp complex subunit ScpB [Kangiella shandongensis]
MSIDKIKCIIEAALMAAGSSLSKERMVQLFSDEDKVQTTDVTKALSMLQEEATGRGIELVEVATGFRYQARQEYAEWVAKLWEERPSRYSRALLETLSLIAYRQPTTRSDIEQVRGVGVSSSIVKTLLEREWIRVVGHRDVPGKPALYATTKQFLDYFGLKSLDELPSLAEIKDLDNLNPELKFEQDEDEGESSKQTEDDTSQENTDNDGEFDENTKDETSGGIDESESDSPEPEEQAESSADDEAETMFPDDDKDEHKQEDQVSSEGEEESEPSLKPTELQD